jgi:hypothetical protein
MIVCLLGKDLIPVLLSWSFTISLRFYPGGLTDTN